MIYRKSAGLKPLVIIGLGAMILTVFCLLPGCGSDSTPKGVAATKETKEKSGKSVGGKDGRMITSLLSDKEGKAPQMQVLDKLPDVTPEQIEAGRKVAEQAMADPKREVFPGLTMEQAERKTEAAQRSLDPKREVFPGLTMEQCNAKLMEAKKHPASAKTLTGLTEEQMKVKAAEAKQIQDAKGNRPDQVFPPK